MRPFVVPPFSLLVAAFLRSRLQAVWRIHKSALPLCPLGFILAANFATAQCVQVSDVTGSITYQDIRPNYRTKLVYDSARAVVLGVEEDVGVVWTYNGQGWNHIIPPAHQDLPRSVSGAAWIYDSARQVSLFFGGTLESDLNSSGGLYSHDTVGWQQITWSGPSPSPAYSALGAFDPTRGRAIFLLFPRKGANVWETWEWTGSSWEQGPTLTDAEPDSFVFDIRHNVGFLSGGDPATGLQAVWIYTPGTTAAESSWSSKVSITGSPYQARFGATLVYDSYRSRILRVGGFDGSSLVAFFPSIDTWDGSSSKWNTIDYDDDLPLDARRATAGVAYDLNRDTLVIYGGFYQYLDNHGELIPTPRTDTWEETRTDPGIRTSSTGTSDHCVGDTAVFSLTASGENLSYQWFHNGVPIPGATFSLLVLDNLSTTDAGNYVGRAENDCGYADTAIIRLRVYEPISFLRPAVWAACDRTCPGSTVSIFPPAPNGFFDESRPVLSIHLQKLAGEFWTDVRVSTRLVQQNFVFTNISRDFGGQYRFYVDGGPCPGVVESTYFIQVGFDITTQPVTRSDVRPCSAVAFSVATAGGCDLRYRWFGPQGMLSDDGRISGATSATLTIDGVRYEDEGNYECFVSDAACPNSSALSSSASLKLGNPQWVLRSRSGPSARFGHAMAYDSARGVTVLFGGGKLSDDRSRYEDFNDVWEWSGEAWKQRTTSSSTSGWTLVASTGAWVPSYTNTPVARRQHAMAFDSRRGRIVLFGGRADSPAGLDIFLSDTWEWDGVSWQFRSSNGPSPRISHSMAYDSSHGVTVLYDGFGRTDPGLVWEWDGTSWTNTAPAGGPSSNYYQDGAAMAYDDARRLIFYGPATDGFRLSFWNWNGATWGFEGLDYNGVVQSSPYGAMAFDSYRRQIVYFGGPQGYFGYYGYSTTAFFLAGGGEFPSHWSLLPDMATTSTFALTDFLDPIILVQIKAQLGPVSQFVWSQLSDATQQILNDPVATIGTQFAALTGELNRIISGPSIYDPQRFAGVDISAEALALRAITLRGPELLRYNRLLLEDAYPNAVARSPSTPSGRMKHAMAYDSRRHASVLFGGLYDPGSMQLVGNETWELIPLDKPIINEQPASQYRQPGQSAFFKAAARAPTGSLLHYQWYCGNQPLNDDAHIDGSQRATLTVSNVTAVDAGQYKVRVSDDCGYTESLTAILTLNPALQIFSVDNFVRLIWSDPNAVLEQADAVTGPWTPVSGAASPFEVSANGAKFFRLNLPQP